MSATTNITVHCIAHTSLNHVEIQRWLYDIGVDEFRLPSEPSEAECLVGLAAKRCYMSFEVGLNPNVTKIRKNWFDYLTNILASGHGSVLEHASYTFAIDGVSRVFTGEMNRHRAGVAISEGSMRYIKLNDLKYWLPTSISDNNDQQRETRAVFKEVFNFIEGKITYLNALWDINEKKKCPVCEGIEQSTGPCSRCNGQGIVPILSFHKKKELTSMFRRLIPMGVATVGIWTMNIRALRHIIAMRTSPSAEEEIALVVGKIAKYMINDCGILFDDFTVSDGMFKPKHHKV